MKTIRLHDTNSILPQSLLIYAESRNCEWLISGIEIHDTFGNCLADDISMDALPPSSQISIIAALNAYDHERRQATRELMEAVS